MTRGDRIDQFLEAFPTRVALSVAILIAMVLREPPVVLEFFFLGLFTTEFGLRMAGMVAERTRNGLHRPAVGPFGPGRAEKQERQVNRRSVWRRVPAVVIDLLAIVSFIPGTEHVPALYYARFGRLLLLLSYWYPLARDFTRIALERDRLQQLIVISGMALLLTAIGAAALSLQRFDATADLDGNGRVDRPPTVSDLVWWSFQQVEDPGHLVQSLDDVPLALISLVLTVGGVLLVAVVIGIGASLVEDLVRLGRGRPIGRSHHMVLLNLTEPSIGVLKNVLEYARHQLGRRRYAVLGPTSARPAFLDRDPYRGVDYRAGLATDASALALLDVNRARRVAVLSPGEGSEADAEAITTLMSVRRLNREAWIVVELSRPSSIAAAIEAGRQRTIPVPARRLAALALAQEIADPGRVHFVVDIVSLSGQELYTCLLGDGRLAKLPFEIEPEGTVQALREAMLRKHRCLLLGGFSASAARTTNWLAGLRPDLHPDPTAPLPRSRGIVAIADRFECLEAAVTELASPGFRAPVTTPRRATPRALAVSVVPLVPVSKVLVLGFNEDTVETVGELLRLFPGADVTVVGADEQVRRRIFAAFIGERTETLATFVATGPKSLALHQADGVHIGTVHVRVADRLHDSLFRHPSASQPGVSPVGSVFDYDAALLLSERGQVGQSGLVGQSSQGSQPGLVSRGDPDAATVLGVLKILDQAAQHGGGMSHRLGHVVVELADRTKHELLRERATGRCSVRFSFVCTSELREDFLCHAFFVPGLSPVLHDLLTAGGHEVVAVRPETADGSVTFLELVQSLGARSPPLVPLAVVLHTGAIHTNPPPEVPIALSEVKLLYCLADAAPVASE